MKRIQKYMSECGIASRRKSEELIKNGKVMINGKIVTELGVKVSEHDIILVDGKSIEPKKKEYYLLYKPEKVVSTTNDEKGRINVIDLINSVNKIYPVGRLDYDTSGLILITNDGELTNHLTHPSFEVEKEYQVKINGIISGEEIKELINGIVIDGIKTKRAKVKLKKVDKKYKRSFLNITIKEGKNHQIKKMFEHFGYDVLKLKRIRYAFLTLENLKKGEYRNLTIKEVRKLYLL